MFRFLLLALFVAMTSAFMAPAISPTLQVPALSMNEAAAKQAWLARAADTGNWGPGTRDPSPRARGAGRLAVRSAAGSLAGRVVPTGTWSASSEPQMPEDAFCTKDRANYDNYLAQNGLLNKAGGGW